MSLIRLMGFLAGSIFSLCILVITATLVYNYTIMAYNAGHESFSRDIEEREVQVTIEEDGATIGDIANILRSYNVIDNRIFFLADSYLFGGRDLTFDAGTFSVNSTMSSREMRLALLNPVEDVVGETVVLMEGLNLREIAIILEDRGIVCAEEFLYVAATETFDFHFLYGIPDTENRLEGYLFPDTYVFLKDSTPRQVINLMLTRFDEIFRTEYIIRAEELGLSIHEVVTIASIIEKEIRVSTERGKASSVIFNRINNGMQLEMCSTVMYVLDKRRDRLLYEDLNVESPYNTYRNFGLPPGPISNPGEACIRAALFPYDTDYLFFVIRNEDTGEHFFTADYNEHLAARARYDTRGF